MVTTLSRRRGHFALWRNFDVNTILARVYSSVGVIRARAMVKLIEVLALLVVLVLCARFRVDLWSLLPWVPTAPTRYDGQVQNLLKDQQNKPKITVGNPEDNAHTREGNREKPDVSGIDWGIVDAVRADGDCTGDCDPREY